MPHKTTNIVFDKDFDMEQLAKYKMCCICMESLENNPKQEVDNAAVPYQPI